MFLNVGPYFLFALDPTNSVAALPMRLVMHGDRKLQSHTLDIDFLMPSGELWLEQLQFLATVAGPSVLCVWCLRLFSLIPLVIQFI